MDRPEQGAELLLPRLLLGDGGQQVDLRTVDGENASLAPVANMLPLSSPDCDGYPRWWRFENLMNRACVNELERY